MSNARPEVHIPPFAGSGTPTPPVALTDHFAPRYIVGNVPAGDPNTAQAAPFVYIPDPGDGTGIASALALASATPGDVWIRPGTYNLTTRAAALAAMLVPAGVKVRCAGRGLVTIVGQTALDQGVFRMAANSALEDCTITVAAGANGTAGQRGVITVEGDAVALARVSVSGALNAAAALRAAISLAPLAVFGLPQSVSVQDISATFTGTNGTVDPCAPIEIQPAPNSSAAWSMSVENLTTSGGDYGIVDPNANATSPTSFISLRDATLSGWVYGGLSTWSVVDAHDLRVASSTANAAADLIAVSTRTTLTTALRDITLEVSGKGATVASGIHIRTPPTAGGQNPAPGSPLIDQVVLVGTGPGGIFGIGVWLDVSSAVGGVVRGVNGFFNLSGVEVGIGCDGVTVRDVYVQFGADGPQVVGVYSASPRTKVSNVTVSGGVPLAGNAYGVFLDVGATECSVQGNTLAMTNGFGINLVGANNSVCVGNVVDMAGVPANGIVNVPVSATVAQNVII